MIRKRNRERERKKDTGTEALVEQRCFNDLSVSVYRLLYKEFLSTMLKIRKANILQLLQGNKELAMVIRSEDNSYLKEEGHD